MASAEARAEPADDFARQLRVFGPIGLLAILVIVAGNILFIPLSAVLVLVWAQRSGTPWTALGFGRPASWAPVVGIGVPAGVVLKLVMKALVMPLFGAPAVNAHYHDLTGNPAALPGILYAVIAGAGFGEETLFRGYFFERLGRLFGPGRAALSGTIVITTTLFALAHYHDQGWPGVEQAAMTGLVFALVFAATRQLWIPMLMHAAFDLAAVTLIYFDWETAVAHLFFR
ncbi:MAG TPA: type II CAAX endopeptidase family protein [Verrucomicrobiae bacterium]|nr:type II CAAX endopeptidase family protein [Verrucomicrobiae bacterium]